MHYTGTLAFNKMKFDSSIDRGVPYSFVLGQGEVIQGLEEGIMRMSLGELAILRIPSDLAYGRQGAGGVIPPNAELDYEVEVLKIGVKEAELPEVAACGGCADILSQAALFDAAYNFLTAGDDADGGDIVDDYYLNLLDWSQNNILAVCLA